jgi:hypothetical protein
MEKYGFTFISQKVLEDVKQGLAKIVIFAPTEGIYGEPEWAILHRWVKDAGLSSSQVHVVHANASLPITDYQFTYHYHDQYLFSFTTRDELAPYTPFSSQNLFVCYNRVRKKHRTLLVCELIAANLAHRGFLSYCNHDQQTKSLIHLYQRSDLIDIAHLLDLSRGLSLDVDLTTTNPAAQLNYGHIQESFLSLVTETLIEDELMFTDRQEHNENFPIFLTEKTYRPISVGHPFMIFGTRHHLKKLKERGFRTFDAWWSEKYDEEIDPNLKTKMIVKEIQKLSAMSPSELRKMRYEMEPVLLHNLTLLKSLQRQADFNSDEASYRIVQSIWNSF